MGNALLHYFYYSKNITMNKLKALAIAILMGTGVPSLLAQTKTETIKVSGNCGMC